MMVSKMDGIRSMLKPGSVLGGGGLCLKGQRGLIPSVLNLGKVVDCEAGSLAGSLAGYVGDRFSSTLS